MVSPGSEPSGDFPSGPRTPAEAGPAAERLSPAEVQRLYDTLGPEVRLFLVGLLRHPELADEALQNTFQRVLEQGHTARSESLKGWLFKVSYHEAMALRRRQTTQDRVLRKYGDREVRSRFDSPPGEPDWRLIQDEDLVRLRQALASLPAEQQDVVERRIHREQTFAVIAQELQLPLGTVLTRMRLALEKLQRQMRDPLE